MTAATPVKTMDPAATDPVDLVLCPRETASNFVPQTYASAVDKYAIIEKGKVAIAAVGPMANYIAAVLNEHSDKPICAIVSGNVNDLKYQYQASGPNCERTVDQNIFSASLAEAINHMTNDDVLAACFQLTHGGTWTSRLQFATGSTNIVTGRCNQPLDWRGMRDT